MISVQVHHRNLVDNKYKIRLQALKKVIKKQIEI